MTPEDLRESTERELVLLLKHANGDGILDLVWGEIIRRYLPRIEQNVWWKVVKNKHISSFETEDIAAHALMKLYENRYKLDPSQGIRGYFNAIAQRLMCDLCRKRKRWPTFSQIGVIEWFKIALSGQQQPGHRLDCRELTRRFRVSARRLDRKERQILAAWRRGGRNWAAKLSKKIDMEAGTIRRRHGLILKKLIRYIEEDFGPIEFIE